jgi:orotate phosphoribosyltransferase
MRHIMTRLDNSKAQLKKVNEVGTIKTRLIKALNDEPGVIKRKSFDEVPFVLASGDHSRKFYDMKLASLNPSILTAMNDYIVRGNFFELFEIKDDDETKVGQIMFDSVAAIAIGGIPLGTMLSYFLSLSLIIVRTTKFDIDNQSNSHITGTGKNVIGNCNDKRILLIEDVITTGTSIIGAVKNIRKEGGLCDHCIVILDREEGGIERCREYGIDVIALIKASEL